MKACYTAIHHWGAMSRVSFDPSKEELAILDPRDGYGDDFKMLGRTVDKQLLMKACIDKLYNEAIPKARRILRAQRFFSTSDLIMQFKAHVWGIIESAVPRIYHAVPSLSAKIDGIQTSFIVHLNITEKKAFLMCGMAPLLLRRDIGMLGVLFKCAHLIAHPDMLELFRRTPAGAPARHNTRLLSRRHDLQLEMLTDGYACAAVSRSLFGFVKVWKALPAFALECKSVSAFQSWLTSQSRAAFTQDIVRWKLFYTISGASLHLQSLIASVIFCFIFCVRVCVV